MCGTIVCGLLALLFDDAQPVFQFRVIETTEGYWLIDDGSVDAFRLFHQGKNIDV